MADKTTQIVIAGFGGQGIVLTGNIIARACVMEDKHVAGMISYGVEMRGGTANATVVISDSEIASPFVSKPDVAIILNQPSLDKFESQIAKNGIVILNSSMITRDVEREDLDVVHVEAAEIARWLGNARVANVVALGAFIAKTGILKTRSIDKAIEQLFAKKKAALITINKKALVEGIKAVTKSN
ncbi:MAG: 2-oxoacid:ferredoxin oxidoreductase subunit gamma [Planctomycetes bacterium]|nr:2-oxoacid:ferredoxin oxidoreductase subunit gamma [Planctomycetota bacterium]